MALDDMWLIPILPPFILPLHTSPSYFPSILPSFILPLHTSPPYSPPSYFPSLPIPQASSMVDEVCSCWAMVNFRKCCSLAKDMNISVPLYYGSLYDPQLLDRLYKAERKKSRLASFFRPNEKPVFTFRAGPLGAAGQDAPLLPYP